MNECALAPSLHSCLHQIAAKIALSAGQVGDPSRGVEAIHNIRTGCKKYLAVLRLAQPALKASNLQQLRSRVKAVKDSVAEARDAHVLAERLEAFAPGFSWLFSRTPPRNPDPGEVMALAASLENSTQSAEWRSPELPDLIQSLAESYSKAHRAARECLKNSDAHELHEWRKVVKSLGYQLALFPDWPFAASLEKKCSKLGSLLGEHHDCAVLLEKLHVLEEAPRAILAKISRHQRKIEKRCLLLGRKIFERAPDDMEEKLLRYARRNPEKTRKFLKFPV